MADKLYFSRDTRVVVRLTGQDHAFEIPVLDGYAFSQATNSSEITLNEMADSDGNSRRARQMFNDSYSPAEWSFSTYAQPLHQVGTGQSAVEAPLWALLSGKAEYTDGAGTNAVWQDGANTYGQEVTESTVNKWKLDFTQSNKSALGTADIYFVMGSANSPASATDMAVYKVEGCCVNEAGFDFDMEGLTTISWSGLGKLVSQITPGHGTTPDDGASEIWYKSDDASLYFKGASAHIAVNKYESDNFIRNRLTQLTIADRDSVGLEAIRNVLTEVGSLGMDTGSGVWSSPYSITQSSGGVAHSNMVPDAEIGGANFASIDKYYTSKTAVEAASGTNHQVLNSLNVTALTDTNLNALRTPFASQNYDVEEELSYFPEMDTALIESGGGVTSLADYFRTDASYSGDKLRLASITLNARSGFNLTTNTVYNYSVWVKIPTSSEQIDQISFTVGTPYRYGGGSFWALQNVQGIIVDVTGTTPSLVSWPSATTTHGTGSANVTNAAIETNDGWMRLSFASAFPAYGTGSATSDTYGVHASVGFMSKKADGTMASFDTSNSDLATQLQYTHTTNQEQGVIIGGLQVATGATNLVPWTDMNATYGTATSDIAVTANQHAFPADVETFLGGTTSAYKAVYENVNGGTPAVSAGAVSYNPSIVYNLSDISSSFNSTWSANAYNASIYVKRTHADVKYAHLRFSEEKQDGKINANQTVSGVVLDFDTGSLVSTISMHASGSTVSDEGSGWYRIKMPLAASQILGVATGGNSSHEKLLRLEFGGTGSLSSNQTQYSALKLANPATFGTTKGIYFGGLQLETGATTTALNSSTGAVGGSGTSTTTRLAVTTNQSALPTAVETATGLSSSADKITLGGAGNHTGRYMVTADLDSGTSGSPTGSHTFSAYVKATDSSVRYVSMQVFDTSSTGDVTAINSPAGVVYNFNTTSFETVSAFSGTTNAASTTDSGWTRISFTANVPSGSNPRLGFSFAGATGFTSGNVAPLQTKHSEVSTHGIEVGGIQMESGGTLSAYQNQNNRPQDPNGTAKAFGLTLTGGNITINNNMTFLTPETMGAVDVPLGHVTGTRSISGSFTCYLNSEDDSSAELFKDIIDGRLTTNDFDLGFGIGNGGTGNDVPRIEIDLDHCHLELPTHNIEDVVSLETNFHALPTTVDDKDELTIKYVSSEA